MTYSFLLQKGMKNPCKTNRYSARKRCKHREGPDGFFRPARAKPSGPHHVTFSKGYIKSARAGPYGSYDKNSYEITRETYGTELRSRYGIEYIYSTTARKILAQPIRMLWTRYGYRTARTVPYLLSTLTKTTLITVNYLIKIMLII